MSKGSRRRARRRGQGRDAGDGEAPASDERGLRGARRRVWSAAAVRRILAILAPLTPLAGLVLLTWGQTFFGAAAVVAVPACSTSDAGLLQSLTGIEVLADTLTVGRGCGTQPGQIYKYVAIVSLPSASLTNGIGGELLAASVSDCFADAAFTNLCGYMFSDGGTGSTYDVAIYAFSKAEWDNAVTPDGGASFSLQSGLLAEANQQAPAAGGGNCTVASAPPQDLAQLFSDLKRAAGLYTTCTATQQSSIPVLAQCGQLGPLPPP